MESDSPVQEEPKRLSPDDALKVVTLAGFPLYLHWSLLLWPYGVFIQWTRLSSVMILFASIMIHELAHAITCHSAGLGKGSITLWVLGGYFRPNDRNVLLPFHMDLRTKLKYAAVIFAGPFSNLLIAGGAYLLSPVSAWPELLKRIGELNMTLAYANLLPIPPLDGGRLALALGMTSSSRQRLQKRLAFGFFVAAVLLVLAFGGNGRAWGGSLLLVMFGGLIFSLSRKTNEQLELEDQTREADPSRGSRLGA